jgi:vitamin B12 transporter
MFLIQKPSAARSLVACAIAWISISAMAQESPEQIAGPADPIVVTATRIPTRYNQLISDVSVVDQEQIRDYGPQAPISDILANEPSITIRSSGGMGTDTSVRLRGTASNQTILLVDGLRINSATTGDAPWAYIPMQQVGRMEIVRGPTSSSYGSDAIGGVIQLFTRKGQGPLKFYADTSYGTYNTTSETAGVEGSTGDFSYSVYGGNTHSVSFPNYITNSKGYTYTQSPASYTNTNASGAFSYNIAAGQEVGLKMLFGGGQNGFTNTSTSGGYGLGAATSQKSLNVLSAYSKNRILDEWTSLIRVGSSQDNTRSWYSNNVQSYFDTTQKQIQWQNDIKTPIGNGMLAYEFLNQAAYVYSSTYQNYSRNIGSVQGGLNGAHGNHLWQANIRNDANSQFGNAVTGSVGYGYFLAAPLRMTASWGTGFQAPTFNQLYTPYASSTSINARTGKVTNSITVGNSNLQPTSSQNTEAGLRYDDGVHSAGVIYYYNNINDQISWVTSSTTSGVTTTSTTQPMNISRAVIQGVSLTYGGEVLGLNFNASMDYQDPQNMATSNALAYSPYVFGSLTTEKKMDTWKLGAQMQSQGQQQSNPGQSSNVTMGGYTLFNLYGDVKVYKDVSAFMRINNLFDKQYVNSVNSTNGPYRTAGSAVFVGLRFDQR